MARSTGNTTAMEKSPLAKLPLEMRYAIYEYALGDNDGPIEITYYTRSTQLRRTIEGHGLGLNLMATCKQINAAIGEIHSIRMFFASNDFTLSVNDS